MKRFIALLIVVLLLLVSVASAEPWRVFDNADLFTDEEIQAIEHAIFDFQRNTNLDFAVLTTDDYIGKENWAALADSFYDCENFGFGRKASGMLYYIDMNQRVPHISTAGEMICIFDDVAIYNAHETVHQLLAYGKYSEATLKMIELATEAVETYKKDAE